MFSKISLKNHQDIATLMDGHWLFYEQPNYRGRMLLTVRLKNHQDIATLSRALKPLELNITAEMGLLSKAHE